MGFEHLLILALLQGATEFLPISSSGHLNLLHALTPLPDAGVGIDVALHGGTLLAVMIYFRSDVAALMRGSFAIILRRDAQLSQAQALQEESQKNLALYLLLASLPILLVGAVLLASGQVDILRSAQIVAWANLIFALPLWLADKYGAHQKTLQDIKLHPTLLIGLAQIFALVPGASRAGVTIMAARALGFNRAAAARFSMLLSMPVIAAFTLAALLDLWRKGDETALLVAFMAAGLAALVALLTIHIFMKMMQKMSLTIFIIYRLVLGLGLLAVL